MKMYDITRILAGALATSWAALIIGIGVALLVVAESGTTRLGMALLAILYYQSHVKMTTLTQLTTLSHALMSAQMQTFKEDFTDENE